jgi:hypothetical protein
LFSEGEVLVVNPSSEIIAKYRLGSDGMRFQKIKTAAMKRGPLLEPPVDGSEKRRRA